MSEQFWEREPLSDCPDCDYYEKQLADRDAEIKRLRAAIEHARYYACNDIHPTCCIIDEILENLEPKENTQPRL